MIVPTDTHSFLIPLAHTHTLRNIKGCVCQLRQYLIWAVSPMCMKKDKGNYLSSPHYKSGGDLGGDDKLVLTSFVCILCLEVACHYGMVLSLSLGYFNCHESVICFSLSEICI